jgi:multiple sugar transport system permease protein
VNGRRQRRWGWILCAPALVSILLVTAYPILYAVGLSLLRYDLRFPDEREFVGLANYLSVLSSPVWWRAVANTLVLTASSVLLELLAGLPIAMLMHRNLFGRRTLRTAVLVPYAIITVVAALAWKFAFDPTTGFVNALLGMHEAWFSERYPAFLVIILTEMWKTTPFMALLLLAGLTLVTQDLLDAARIDGANAWQRLFRITLPMMKGTILVALLFRTMDALRIFDTVFIQTRGAQDTATVSLVGYDTLIVRLNLGLGSTVSVLMFLLTLGIAALFIKAFRSPLLPSVGSGADR